MLLTRTEPKLIAIARGEIAGAGIFRAIGRNPDVDDVREDLWETGGDYVFPPDGGIQMQVVSSSANDTSVGTGARSVDIHYLDAEGNPHKETIVMNGTTAVNTLTTDIWRVQDFHVKTAGTSQAAAGTITLRNMAASAVYATLSVGTNRCRQAIWTVPAGAIGLITEAWIGGNADGGSLANYAEGYLRATCDFSGELTPGLFQFKWGAISASATTGGEMEIPIVLPSLCDVKMSVKSRSSNSNVLAVGGFSGWYESQ